MYTAQSLADVINALRHVDVLRRKPAGLRTESLRPPQRSDFGTDREYAVAWNDFLRTYDLEFRAVSPFGVSCVNHDVLLEGNRPEIYQAGLKTYRRILWDVYAVDRRLVGDSDTPLNKPPDGVNITVDNEIDW
jgi:hypothetical protein